MEGGLAIKKRCDETGFWFEVGVSHGKSGSVYVDPQNAQSIAKYKKRVCGGVLIVIHSILLIYNSPQSACLLVVAGAERSDSNICSCGS
jgi:hypothetical protein